VLRWVTLLVLSGAVVCTACGSDDKPRLKGYGFDCSSSDQCAAHLTCRYSRCRQSCDDGTGCDDGVCLKSAVYENGVCAIADETPCADIVCAIGLACGADGTCRPECQSGDDCASGDSCSAGVCASP
jgi:hypothetical protein